MSTGPELFVICRNCGSEVSPYITECPYCGHRLRKRAPKLDREGRVQESKRRRPRAPKLPRLRPGEMPGVRPESRPYATIVLVLASIVLTLAWRAGAVSIFDIAITGPLDGDYYRLATAPLVYDNTGYQFAALVTIALFGWLNDRRHGPVAVATLALIGGPAAMAAAVALESSTIALGGNGIALALLAAWAVPDLRASRRGEEVEGDLLGVAAFALVMLLMPLAVSSADPVVGLVGAVGGLIAGWFLDTIRPGA